MRIICWVVTRKLAGLPPGGSLPGWVARHIDGCEHCASEEAAYAKLSAVLRTDDPADKSCTLSWDNLRSTLDTRPAETLAPRRRSAWIAIGASAAAAALVVTAAASLWLRPMSKQTGNRPEVVRQAEQKRTPTDKQAPMVAEQPPAPDQAKTDALAPDPQTVQWTSPVPQPPAIKHRVHRLHPVVSRVRPHVAVVRQNRIKAPTPVAPNPADRERIADVAVVVPKTPSKVEDRQTEPAELAVVAPSEQVIDVVGAGSPGEGERVGMIQQVSYQEVNSSARL